MCVFVYDEKGGSLSLSFFQFKRAPAHLHYECRPGSLVESPRGVLERPRPAGDEKSLLTYDTATCVEADEEEEGAGGRGWNVFLESEDKKEKLCYLYSTAGAHTNVQMCFPGFSRHLEGLSAPSQLVSAAGLQKN